jgi:large subunit ribosomal protein L23
MNADMNQIIRVPLITEESTIGAQESNQYAFRVDPRANKNQIRDAIEKIYNVRVVSVNTMNYRGKRRRRGRITGRRPDWKKAIVTLREGDAIDLF